MRAALFARPHGAEKAKAVEVFSPRDVSVAADLEQVRSAAYSERIQLVDGFFRQADAVRLRTCWQPRPASQLSIKKPIASPSTWSAKRRRGECSPFPAACMQRSSRYF